MKNLHFKLMLFLFVCSGILNNVFAQAPEGVIYQAEARDNRGIIVSNSTLDVKIIIYEDNIYGNIVWEGLHNVTTNQYGMFVLVIGEGTSGYDFAAIEWGNHAHFLNVQVKTTKGNKAKTWIDMGTTQLLSVPYALHAKTAEGVTGTITETDPVFTGSQAANITANDITNLNNLSGTNSGDQDGSETKVTAGTNINVTGSGTTASPYVVNSISGGGSSLAIGDSYQGGIVFWLDATGQHGLIAATADQSTGIKWYNGIYRYTGTTGDGLYAGAMNTTMIVATQMADNQTGNFAAKVCADYSVTVGGVTYGDWYLPSKYELNLLYTEKTAVGGFASADYWSSTENLNDIAWIQYFDLGYQTNGYQSLTYYVRAVRAF